MQPSTLQQPIPPPRYDEAFYLYSFKIVPCNNTASHNWSLCPFVHSKEKARRRDPRLYNYQPLPCPEDRKGVNCPRGDECPYTHNVYEYWLHPQRFRTQMCQQGQLCTRPLCFFAHTLEELRAVNQNGAKAVQPTSQRGISPLTPSAAGSTSMSPALAALSNGGSNAAGSIQQGIAPHPTNALTMVHQPPLQQQQYVQQAGMNQLVAPSFAQSQQSFNSYQPALMVQRPHAPHSTIQDASLRQQQAPGVVRLQVQHLQTVPGGLFGVDSTILEATGGLQAGQPQLHQALPAPTAEQLQLQPQLVNAQQTSQAQVLYAPSQAQQQQMLPQILAGHGQALPAAQDQGVMNPAFMGQQIAQVQILQQPQQPWLQQQQQQQVASGGSAAHLQLLHVQPASQVLAQGGWVEHGVATEQSLQTAMQQMSLQ